MAIASTTMAQTISSSNNKYENFQFFDTKPKKDYKFTNEYTFKKIGLVLIRTINSINIYYKSWKYHILFKDL